MGVLSGSRSRVAGGLLAAMCLLAAAFIPGYPGVRVLAASGTKPPKEFFAYVEWSQSRYDKAWRYSRLGKEPHTNEGATSSEWEWPCGATTDPNCAVSETFIRRRTGQNGKKMVGSPEAGLEWTSIFPYCESAFQMNCIIGLTIKDSRGTEEGLFIGGNTNDYQSLEKDWPTTPKRLSYETYKPFKGDMSRLIPDGGLAPLFSTNPSQLDGEKISRPSTYRVRVSMDGFSDHCESKVGKKMSNCQPIWVTPNEVSKFTLQVQKGQASGEVFVKKETKDGLMYQSRVPTKAGEFTFLEEELPADSEFSIQMRISAQLLPKGWLSGRVVRPGFKQKAIANGFEIEVSGAAAQVPSTAVYFTCADKADTRAKNFLDYAWRRIILSGAPDIATCAGWESSPGVNQGALGENFFCPNIIPQTLLLQTLVEERKGDCSINEALFAFEAADNAVGSLKTEWAMRWAPTWKEWTSGSACDSMGLVGVVGTNAAIYGDRPIFDPTTGQLTFQMVGQHNLADGTLNVGSLTLVIRRDYAMCQWGVDPSPSTVLATILNSSSSAATPANIDMRVEGDFFRIEASSVTFSAPQMAIGTKVTRVNSTKSLFVESGSSIPITKVVKSRKGYVASWYVKKGLCRITKRDTKTLWMAKKGTCEVLVTEFNTKSRTAKRTLLKLS